MLYNIIFLESFIFFYISCDNVDVTVTYMTLTCDITLDPNSGFLNKKMK